MTRIRDRLDGHEKKCDGEFHIRDPQALKALASPVRLDIVDTLAAHGPLAIKELGSLIGREPASIYHHLRILLAAGLVREAASRVVNRRVEKLFDTPFRRMRLAPALAEGRQDAIMTEIVASLCRQADRDFASGLERKSGRRNGPQTNLRFFRLVNRLAPDDLELVNEKLDEIAEILWRAPAEGAPVVALTWVLAPVADEDA